MFFIARLARSRWFRTGLVVLVIMVVVWLLGPMLGLGAMHPLETEIARYIAIGVLFLLWVVSNLLHEVQASRRDKRLAEGVAEPAVDVKARETDRASAEEVALLKERLHQAMQSLKKSKLGGSRKRLSAMPWYVMIGPPGAGKTTALQNCGLKFPLETKQPVRGVGGTRNCEWMFTDEAVLIDTAGRYTTQDSAEAVDSAAWLGFLDMLKKRRRRRPLNGVLVAISLSDLAVQSEAERSAHARAIRQRLRELQDRLGLRLPVYVLFTKADLIAGFSEFFDNLGKEEREQVWGMTLPLDEEGGGEEGVVALVPGEFDLLVGRLNDRMLERVHQEPDIRRRRLIYGFPQQVASLKEVAGEFLTEIFRPSRLEARPLLRGVYLTSGTQEGMAIDRLLGTMAAEFGLPRQAVAAPSGPGRSYFLSRLLREVVFGEAALAGLDKKVERRERIISVAAYAACGLVLVVLTGSWFSSYLGNRDLIAQVHAGTVSYRAQFAELLRRGPGDQDLIATLPALDTLRNIRGGYGHRDQDTPVSLTFGLYQGSKLSQAAQDSYVGALNRILLPRILTRVEAQLAARMSNLDFLYQTLKVYLVLGRQGPLDRELVTQWAQADLLAAYPGEEDGPAREALLGHIDAMLQQPIQPVPLNDALVAQARAALTREPLAEYSYNRLMRSKRVLAIPVWTVAENGGPGAGRVFQYKSGKPLDTGVAGIYTWAGYHNVFLPLLTTVTQDITEDGWVLGHEKRDVQATIRDTGRLRKAVLGLYLDDYARKWDAMLADIAVKPFSNMQQALDQLSLLSAPSSPLRELMQSIDAQTQLSRAAASDAALAAAEAKAARVGQRASGFAAFEARSGLSIRQNELVGILSDAFGTDPAGKPVDPAKGVDDHFRGLHDFVSGNEARPAGLETAIQRIQGMYQGFNQTANAANQGQSMLGALGGGGGAGGAAAGGSPAAQLQEMTRSMPPEVSAMLGPVARNATTLAASGASQELADAWKSQVVPLCESAFQRYPFVAGSKDDVPIDDFTQLLGPGGKMEAFFNQYLKPFVDTSSKPWRWQAAERAPLNLSAASLAQFELAAQIREGLFTAGPAIQVRFQLTPATMDAGVGQVSVDIAGQTLTYAHGPTEGTAFTWPGPGGKSAVRVTMTPTGGGQATITDKDGPWALLRLLDGHIAGGGQPDKFKVTFQGGGGAAVFDLAASSVRNPFTLAALRSFRCPAKL